MKKLGSISLALVLIMALGFVACGKGGQAGGKKTLFVGIAMPTQSSQRWIQDGGNMKKILESRGYKVDLQYAEDNIDAQIAQLENMITKGVNCLVIASIDGESLTNVLKKAAAAKIPVIAYDRLIRNTPHVDYYATFDNYKVGVQQGSYIVEKLGLKEGKGPYNIEIFAGSPDDNNAYFFYNGAMDQLKPYIEKGQLVVRSGQIEFDKVATLRWDGATAQQRMDNILTAYYTNANLDAVLSPYDGISIGVLSALKSVGYGRGGKKLPIVTGQDAEIPSVKSIIAGEQAHTIFKDTRVLAEKAADMVDAVLQGKPAPVNDTTTYDNGVKVVPSYLCEPVSVDITNYKEVLIGSGYYTEDQLK
ncbi:MAG TPA: sugar ABC transporter substrate-binding protein [Termitinemataceae bacterium]|jgi:putative multiple sugar transport system substrate-binding protein|nr:sugar ABC transporter substrate-binding protein [Termitinemataceae bacterium]HOM23788.1 sugar ABC transporter substrate-binding protein [Termitinemataceae bacterium]HPQ00828.1 sugar ABC transporter substrate-binding protein [Termitinemataceae bacterium]